MAGLVLNRVGSDRHLELLKTALEPLKIPVLGVLRRHDAIAIPDRHLGLVPTDELNELELVIEQLADLGESSFEWTELLPLLKAESLPILHSPLTIPRTLPSVKLAVARDRAFSFYYPDNLELLEQLGAELVFWSPLADTSLPPGIQGLYFGGGFPEVFAEPLSQNRSVRLAVKAAIESGMPTYAECGGLMYLTQQLVDFEERPWDMVGIFPTMTRMQSRLTLGYRRAVAMKDSPLMPSGSVVWGHEFHRSTITNKADTPLYTLQGYDPHSPYVLEGWRSHQVHASYVHLHWGSRPEIPAHFLQSCLRFSEIQSM